VRPVSCRRPVVAVVVARRPCKNMAHVAYTSHTRTRKKKSEPANIRTRRKLKKKRNFEEKEEEINT